MIIDVLSEQVRKDSLSAIRGPTIRQVNYDELGPDCPVNKIISLALNKEPRRSILKLKDRATAIFEIDYSPTLTPKILSDGKPLEA